MSWYTHKTTVRWVCLEDDLWVRVDKVLSVEPTTTREPDDPDAKPIKGSKLWIESPEPFTLHCRLSPREVVRRMCAEPTDG